MELCLQSSYGQIRPVNHHLDVGSADNTCSINHATFDLRLDRTRTTPQEKEGMEPQE